MFTLTYFASLLAIALFIIPFNQMSIDLLTKRIVDNYRKDFIDYLPGYDEIEIAPIGDQFHLLVEAMSIFAMPKCFEHEEENENELAYNLYLLNDLHTLKLNCTASVCSPNPFTPPQSIPIPVASLFTKLLIKDTLNVSPISTKSKYNEPWWLQWIPYTCISIICAISMLSIVYGNGIAYFFYNASLASVTDVKVKVLTSNDSKNVLDVGKDVIASNLSKEINIDTLIKPEHYATGEVLGKGAFGSVYRGLNLETGRMVAIKQTKLIGTPKSQMTSMMMEIDLLKKLNHKHIVKYIGFYKTEEHLNILTEFCESGSLLQVMKKFGPLSEKLVGMYTAQVLEGLKYLHSQGVIHRDIKAANLLTDKQGTVKLADFGIAITTDNPQDPMDVIGSPYWMAPEIVELNGATTASDVWSLGATVIELCTGKPPYIDCPQMTAMFKIVEEEMQLPDLSKMVKDFLAHCFQKDPSVRATSYELQKHPWIVSNQREVTQM